MELQKLGKYGRMAMKYLEEMEPQRYKTLFRFGKLAEKMQEVEEEANNLLEMLMEQYLAKHKPHNPSSTMEMWKLRKQAKMQGGSSFKSVRDEVSLEDEELNRELNELDSFEKTEAVNIIRLFFDPEYGYQIQISTSCCGEKGNSYL